jgi:hypothetical protein
MPELASPPVNRDFPIPEVVPPPAVVLSEFSYTDAGV